MLGRKSTQAVFVADRLPVSQRALVLAHSGRTAEQDGGEQAGEAGENSSVRCAHGADDFGLAGRRARAKLTRNYDGLKVVRLD